MIMTVKSGTNDKITCAWLYTEERDTLRNDIAKPSGSLIKQEKDYELRQTLD